MSAGNREVPPPRVLVPQAPVLVAGHREVLWLSPDGEIEVLTPAEARGRVERETPMVCHARATARRLDLQEFAALDLLELFAFVHPAKFCVPTPRGLAEALGLSLRGGPAEACVTLATAARALLQERTAPAPGSAPGNDTVRPEDARMRLAELLGAAAEPRPQQADSAAAVAA